MNIGQVTAVQLSPDYTKVEVTAKIAKSAAGLMVEDAKFWVVEPRVTLSGVSGLGTLLSGNYIGFEAGKSTKNQRTFSGLDEPPIITSAAGPAIRAQGGQARLARRRRAHLLPPPRRPARSWPTTCRSDGKAIDVKIFVNAPYDQYVNPGTRFWNASGIDVSVGAGGVEVRTESLVALIAGGVAFDTPSVARAAQPPPPTRCSRSTPTAPPR